MNPAFWEHFQKILEAKSGQSLSRTSPNAPKRVEPNPNSSNELKEEKTEASNKQIHNPEPVEKSGPAGSWKVINEACGLPMGYLFGAKKVGQKRDGLTYVKALTGTWYLLSHLEKIG